MMNTFRYAFRFLRRQKHFTLINGTGLALVEALAVTVVEGDISYSGCGLDRTPRKGCMPHTRCWP